MRSAFTFKKFVSTQTSSSMLEKAKISALSRFQSQFNKKAKIAIVGTSVSGLAAALKLHQHGITPTVLETVNMPNVTQERTVLINNYAVRLLNGLEMETKLSKNFNNLDVYERVDADSNKVFASINYSEVFVASKCATSSVEYAKFWLELRNEAASKMEFLQNCKIISISTEENDTGDYVEFDEKYVNPGCDRRVEFVKNRVVKISYSTESSGAKNYTDAFDVLLIAEGPISPTCNILYPHALKQFENIHLEESIITRPQIIASNKVVDIWGWTYRCGYVPLNNDRLYAYCVNTLPPPCTQGNTRHDEDHEEMLSSKFALLKEPHSHLSSLVRDNNNVSSSYSTCQRMDLLHMSPEEPILVIGSTQAALTLPSFGQDLAMELESGIHAAFACIDSRGPLLHCLNTYRVLSKQYQYLFESKRQETLDACSLQKTLMLPLALCKAPIKLGQHGSNRLLMDYETSFRGIAREATERRKLVLFNDRMTEDMRSEWLAMSETQQNILFKLNTSRYNQRARSFQQYLEMHHKILKSSRISLRDINAIYKQH